MALEITKEVFEHKYLGPLAPEGRMRKGSFERLPDSLRMMLVDWSEKIMSSCN